METFKWSTHKSYKDNIEIPQRGRGDQWRNDPFVTLHKSFDSRNTEEGNVLFILEISSHST